MQLHRRACLNFAHAYIAECFWGSFSDSIRRITGCLTHEFGKRSLPKTQERQENYFIGKLETGTQASQKQTNPHIHFIESPLRWYLNSQYYLKFRQAQYSTKKNWLSSRQPIFINLKSNTMKNTVQRYALFHVIKHISCFLFPN